MRRPPADRPVVAVKSLLAGVGAEPRGRLIRNVESINQDPGRVPGGREEACQVGVVKPFDIPKQVVWEAYRRVAANKGAPGVDVETLDEFEADLKDNLYKIWNRMSSGSYFPPPVRAVEIPKPHGRGVRLLGVPTVADRVAQTVVAAIWGKGGTTVPPRLLWLPAEEGSLGCGGGVPTAVLEVRLGDRPRCPEVLRYGAVGPRRQSGGGGHRQPLGAAVREAVACRPAAEPDGTLVERDKGTPQGSAVSPILANLFMHFAFDNWMVRNFPDCPWERYADDAVVHCGTRRQAEEVLAAIAERMGEVGLRLHPDKTRIVYCKDGRRRGDHEHTSFTFLGFTFRARKANGRNGEMFTASCLR